jgi:hypothetical protein
MLSLMGQLSHSLGWSIIFLAAAVCWGNVAEAQEAPPPAPPTQSFPAPTDTPPAPQPYPQQQSPAQAPAPAPGQPSAPYPPAPAQPYGQPPAYAQPGYPAQPQYAQPGYAQPEYAPAGYPPPPPQRPDDGFQVPEFSIRIDPFNWLLEGRLGLELESQVWKFISVEVVPVFVTNTTPPTLNYFQSFSGGTLSQHSNGLGALAGASVGAGFWLGGKPFRGYVLRTAFTDYAFSYKTSDASGPIDQVNHTERFFYFVLGEEDRWGPFTIAGGVGLGYELNQQNRCFPDTATNVGQATTSCPHPQLAIALDRGVQNITDLHSELYPFDLVASFSLGVVF